MENLLYKMLKLYISNNNFSNVALVQWASGISKQIYAWLNLVYGNGSISSFQ